MIKKLSKSKSLILKPLQLLAVTSVLGLAGCQGKGGLFNFKVFKERATETPSPDELNIEKSFFLAEGGKSKTFLCAWAPEVSIGEVGEMVFGHLDHAAPHCNLEFEVKDQNWLVGRMINASFSNQPEDRRNWKEYVRIPITSHFYFEKARDAQGRETNEWIENTSRSHYSARPMMKLNLAGIQFMDPGLVWGSAASGLDHSTATEIEWDKQNGFLGFTLNVSLRGPFSWQGYLMGSEAQAKVRVNFMRFEHDPQFKKTPFHQENSKLMNILHVMGHRHQTANEYYAAHWDFSKPIQFYINGATEKQVQELLLGAVEKWNQVLEEEGIIQKGQKAFVPVVHQRKHAFDLRYPGINYIADRRISMNSSLGVGYAHADVRNGKILWGNVLIFGGIIESLIQSYSENESGSGGQSGYSHAGFAAQSRWLNIPDKLGVPIGVSQFAIANRSELQKNLDEGIQGFLSEQLREIRTNKGSRQNQTEKIQSQIEDLKKQVNALAKPSVASKIVADISQMAMQLDQKAQSQFTVRGYRDLIGMKDGQNQFEQQISISKDNKAEVRRIVSDAKNGSDKLESLKRIIPSASSGFPDQDLTARQVQSSLGLAQRKNKKDFKFMWESIMMHLALHELGHMIGLGHQFKDNIIPEEGTVPSSIRKELLELATEENEFSNLTSVMGYLSGRTWISLDAKKLMPGVQDRLVLRYLYKQEFAMFDKDQDQFKFQAVPKNGQIPQKGYGDNSRLMTTYMPQCNDIEASYMADPFCNRWDRGQNAEQLVKSYFEELSGDLVSDLYNFSSGTRGSPDESEGRLWYRSFNTMARVRLFYDELRLMLETENGISAVWSQVRRNKAALYEFSSACEAGNKESVQSELLQKIMFDYGKQSARIRDLCRASKLALNEIKFLLTLPENDYTKIDTKQRYIMSGYLIGDVSVDDRQAFGKWYQLSNLPLKMSSLFTLTTPYSYLWPGVANPFFTLEGRTPLYRTLFAGEYTRLISEMVESNMRFEALEDSERTSLGRTILSSSWLLPFQDMMSTDAGLLPSDFLRVIKNQTEFGFSMAAVMVTASTSQSDVSVRPNHYKRFSATMFDLMLNRSRTARDVYLLPEGMAIARVNDMFLVPMTPLKFIEDNVAYYIAIKVDYSTAVGDKLAEQSVKARLTEKHEQLNSICISGQNGTGLSYFFSGSDSGESNGQNSFSGFYIPPGIAQDSGTEKMTEFYRSLDAEFAKYEIFASAKSGGSRNRKSMKVVCDQALRGVGQIASAAAILNGFWLPVTELYIK